MNRVTVAVAAAVVIGVLAGCTRRPPESEPVRPVQLAQVGTGGAPGASVLAGEVKPRYETDLGFRIAGKIIERRVDVGARVRRGQALAQLDSIDVGLQVQAAQAAFNAADTDFRFAQSEYQRYQDLHAQKFISASALDAKRSAFDTARSRLDQARAQLAVTRNQAEYATLAAPDDGVITAINVEAGQVVSVGQAVMKLARENEHEVAISVPENRLGELRSARALVAVLWANPSKRYAGRVREIAPAVDPVTRTFAVRVSILDPDPALQWGMTANVGIVNDGQRDAALLPLSSIYHGTDGAPAVWVYDTQTHKVQLRDVKLLAYREDGVLVDGGVKPGDWVVAAGVNKLEGGQLVRPYESAGVASPDSAALQARS
jgi:membrane fusion protein, multidrug efflux system